MQEKEHFPERLGFKLRAELQLLSSTKISQPIVSSVICFLVSRFSVISQWLYSLHRKAEQNTNLPGPYILLQELWHPPGSAHSSFFPSSCPYTCDLKSFQISERQKSLEASQRPGEDMASIRHTLMCIRRSLPIIFLHITLICPLPQFLPLGFLS